MRLIDADALLDEVMDRYCEECDKRKGIKNGKFRIIYEIGDAPCRACEIDDVKTELEDAPTIDPVKHGRWEYNIILGWCSVGTEATADYVCSVCGWHTKMPTAYCPNCGSYMLDGTQKKPCDDCQQFDCYGCEYAERNEDETD